MPDLISSRRVKARKVHNCQCCESAAIQPGDEYERQTLVNDGRIYDWVSCVECDKLFGIVYAWCTNQDDGIGQGEYDEWARDCANDAEHGEMARAYLLRADL